MLSFRCFHDWFHEFKHRIISIEFSFCYFFVFNYCSKYKKFILLITNSNTKNTIPSKVINYTQFKLVHQKNTYTLLRKFYTFKIRNQIAFMICQKEKWRHDNEEIYFNAFFYQLYFVLFFLVIWMCINIINKLVCWQNIIFF